MGHKDLHSLIEQLDPDEAVAVQGWLLGTKVEKTRPAVFKVEVQKPQFPGGLHTFTLWSYFGEQNHRASGVGDTIERAQVEAALAMEDQFQKFLELRKPWMTLN